MDGTLARLADFATSLSFDDIPQTVLHETKRHILDFFGCALGAFSAEPIKAIRRMASGVLGSDLGATVLATAHCSIVRRGDQ